MIRECIHIVQEGIATAEDVDLAVKAGVGLRLPAYGVFEHADLVGLDLVKADGIPYREAPRIRVVVPRPEAVEARRRVELLSCE
jgi:3-hydroxyacyl-CoA dehydrogenase